MSAVVCWNCGRDLADIPRPISRHNNCPACFSDLHCCRMCKHFLPERVGVCAEDRADPPVEKENANFCDFFRPSATPLIPTKSPRAMPPKTHWPPIRQGSQHGQRRQREPTDTPTTDPIDALNAVQTEKIVTLSDYSLRTIFIITQSHGIATLNNVLKVFGAKPTEQEQSALAEEVMLMTLSRATAATPTSKKSRSKWCVACWKSTSAKSYSSADIRIAANSEMYEVAPLQEYLASVSNKMRSADKVQTIQALAEVINVDGRVNAMEITFFNEVATALALTPAQIMGLVE